jgi:hypothetical protein
MSVNIDAGGNAVLVSARKVKFHVPTVPTVLGNVGQHPSLAKVLLR